ncbi:MAG: hypothetical protein KUG75_01690 [Pseudomonadales bacterium]|nr:hypothetical protein [Pseudomonadales bacterium]
MLQILVPTGYMPAPLSSGSIIQLCPGSLPAGVRLSGTYSTEQNIALGSAHHEHHHDDTENPEHNNTPSLCTFAAFATNDGLQQNTNDSTIAATSIPLIFFDHSTPHILTRTTHNYRTRAPPKKMHG